MELSLNVVTLLYLVASVFFIQALKGLSHPTTSIRGNLFGMAGMAIAILTTAALIVKLSGEAAVGMGYVRNPDGVDRAWIESGRYEIEIAGERFPATVHLRPPFDPAGERIRG